MSTTQTIEYDPFSPEVRLNPYPHYAMLREHSPVHYVESQNFWVLSRYDDLKTAAGDPTFSASRGQSAVDPYPKDGSGIAVPPSIGSLDPPEHTELRRIVQSVFGTGQLRGWIPRVTPLAEAVVANLIEHARSGEADFIHDVSFPLPSQVIAELMALPTADCKQLFDWSNQITGVLPGVQNVGMEAAMTAGKASMEMTDYVMAIIAERRKAPVEGDVVSNLIAARNDAGRQLTQDELVGHVMTLMLAGMETTESLMGNVMVALLQYPDEKAKLVEDPERITAAVEEVLRWSAPAQGTFRQTLREIEVGGVAIPEDSRVQMLWASGNRDTNHFDDPEAFIVDRKRGSTLSFGHSAHFCIGAFLARAETNAVFRALLRDAPDIDFAADPVVAVERMPVVRKHAKVLLRIG